MKLIALTSDGATINRTGRSPRPAFGNGHYSNGGSHSSNGLQTNHTEGAISRSAGVRSPQDDPLLRGLLPTAAGSGQAVAGLSGNSANEVMFVYCSQGRGSCEIEGKRHEVLPGDLLVALPGLRRANCKHLEGWEVTWIRAKGQNLHSFIEELGVTEAQPVLEVGQDPQLLSLFHEVARALEEPCQRPRLIYAAQTLGHLLGLLIWHTKDVERAKPDLARRVDLSIDYMQQHLAKPLHVANLAMLVNVSPSYYAVLFKRHTGCSPIDYFIRLRMKQACRLLESSALHIKEIAALLGYDDPFYFSRVFRAVVQSSPSEYRQSRREMEARAMLGQAAS